MQQFYTLYAVYHGHKHLKSETSKMEQKETFGYDAILLKASIDIMRSYEATWTLQRCPKLS